MSLSFDMEKTLTWFCVSGASGCPPEPGEDHVSVLPVHGDLHGPSSVRGKDPNPLP